MVYIPADYVSFRYSLGVIRSLDNNKTDHKVRHVTTVR